MDPQYVLASVATDELLIGIAIGVVVGFLISYPVGFLRELGKNRAERHVTHRDSRRSDRAQRRADKNAAKEAEAAERASAEEHDRLAAARVGAVFVRRNDHPDRIDEVLRVVALDGQRWRQRVVVEVFTDPHEASPAPAAGPKRVSMEWRSLTEPIAAQKHRTARLVLDSFDDSEGWMHTERVDHHKWIPKDL